MVGDGTREPVPQARHFQVARDPLHNDERVQGPAQVIKKGTCGFPPCGDGPGDELVPEQGGGVVRRLGRGRVAAIARRPLHRLDRQPLLLLLRAHKLDRPGNVALLFDDQLQSRAGIAHARQ